MRWLSALAFFFVGSIAYATSSASIIGVTNTQIVIALNTDQQGTCTISVSSNNIFGAGYLPVHDVDTSLFPNSNQCVRARNITNASPQIIVIGKRVSESAPNGIYYSRALQEEKQYYIQFNVGLDTVTLSAQTGIVPFGLGQSEIHTYPWPTISESTRNVEMIEPTTGMLMKNIYLPADMENFTTNPVVVSTIQVPATNWTNPTNIIVDDSSDAAYQGSAQDILYGQMDIYQGREQIYSSHSEAQFTSSLVYIQINMNAWVSSFSVTADRQVDVALSDNGLSPLPGTTWTTVTLSSCTSGCTGGTFRPVVGSTASAMAYWTTISTPLPTGSFHLAQRSATVNVSGSSVTYASGGYFFDRNWRPGTPVMISGVLYTIAQALSSHVIVLNQSAGNQSGVVATIVPFGVIARKTNTATNILHIQYLAASFQAEGELPWSAGSNQDENSSCGIPDSSNTVICQLVSRMYSINLNTGNAIYIGLSQPPERAGQDGWHFLFPCQMMFDETDPRTAYCSGVDPTGVYNLLIKAVLTGTFTSDVPPVEQISGAKMPDCSLVGAPCWTFTNLTPVSSSLTVTQQMTANDPICAKYAGNGYTLLGTAGKYLELHAYISQNRIGCLAAFDSTTGLYQASRSGDKPPMKYAGLHGWGRTSGVTSNPWMFFAGEQLGEDDDTVSTSAIAGLGPYVTHINSGLISSSTVVSCPANPGNTTIPANQWPVGNLCLQFTVVGEPCDPSIDSSIETADGGSHCGAASSGWYWLVNSAPGDYGCITQNFITSFNSGVTGCGFGGKPGDFGQTAEFFRLLTKSVNGPNSTWTIQRGYTRIGPNFGSDPTHYANFASSAEIIMASAGCIWYNSINGDACGNNIGFFNILTSSNATPQGQAGQGHSDVRPGGWLSAIGPGQLTNGGFSVYNWTPGGLSDFSEVINSSVNYTLNSDVTFNSARGVGSTNPVDSHPNLPRTMTVPFSGDARVFNGLNSFVTPTVVAGTLMKWSSGTIANDGARQYFSPKNFPTMVYTDGVISTDISGPGVIISTSISDLNHHCVVQIAGECRPGSVKGEVYANAYSQAGSCNYAGIGAGAGDLGDTCVFAPGANTFTINQVYLSSGSELEGNAQRRLTYGLSNPNWLFQFWNVRFTPGSKWMIYPVFYANEKGSSIMLAKMPSNTLTPSINRQQFQNIPVSIGSGPDARIRFGYDDTFKCTSRNDQCLTTPTPTPSDPFMFLSEGASYTSCSSGCTINIPALPGRVLYYAVERNGFGYGQTEVRAVQ